MHEIVHLLYNALYPSHINVQASPPALPFHAVHLLDLLLLQLDRLIVNEHSLALIRLRRPPLPHPTRKRHDHLLIHALNKNSRRLRCRNLDTHWNRLLDGVREPQLEAEELLAGELCFLATALFDCCTVTNTNEAEDGGVAFGDAHDVVVKVGPACACGEDGKISWIARAMGN